MSSRILSKAAVLVFACLAGFLIAAKSIGQPAESFHRYWPDNLFAVDFVSENVGFVAGQAGTLLRTLDGGSNWESVFVGENELIRRVDFVNENEGWAVGHRGSILHTADAGLHWNVQLRVPETYLRDVDFADTNNGWVVGHGATILHTRDGGVTWEKENMQGYRGRDLPRFHGIYAKDSATAVVVGEFGSVVHTEDGGRTWLVTPSEIGITWLAVDGVGDSIFTVGADGSAAHLVLATDEQRAEIESEANKKSDLEDQRARKKAERRKQKYIPAERLVLPRPSREYVVNSLETGTREHLFDVAMANADTALAVGRSSVLSISAEDVRPLMPSGQVPLDYVWFGGVSITPAGKFWAPGIRGLIISGEINSMSFDVALNLPASSNITLISSQWSADNGK